MEDHGEQALSLRDIIIGFTVTAVAVIGVTVWLFADEPKPKPEE